MVLSVKSSLQSFLRATISLQTRRWQISTDLIKLPFSLPPLTLLISIFLTILFNKYLLHHFLLFSLQTDYPRVDDTLG